ncbi:MAG: ABC transporter permease, partial [Bacteroidales bacterium]|nr:ABC transporter permease [Candidatus Latescibacterota bacterium]
MISLIIEKELRDMLRSRKFQLSFIVCSFLIILTFFVGAKNHQLNMSRHESAVRENLRKMEGITDWMEVRNTRVFLPPSPLEALVCGVSNDIGRTIEVSGTGELVTEDSRYNENPVMAVFRFLDLNFIFQIVLSLFAILFVFDAVNGEKERGTLRLIFANSLPRDKFIIGKWAGTMLAVCVPMIVPILVGCLILPLSGVQLSGGEWSRLAIIVLTGFLFFSTFVALSLFISTLSKKSSNAFLALLVVWIFAVLIVPRSAVLLAGNAVEVPSVDEIQAQKTRFRMQSFMEDFEKMDGFKPESTGDPEKAMAEFSQLMEEIHNERDEKLQAFADRLNEERKNRQIVQQKVAFNLARVSPSASFSLA